MHPPYDSFFDYNYPFDKIQFFMIIFELPYKIKKKTPPLSKAKQFVNVLLYIYIY